MHFPYNKSCREGMLCFAVPLFSLFLQWNVTNMYSAWEFFHTPFSFFYWILRNLCLLFPKINQVELESFIINVKWKKKHVVVSLVHVCVKISFRAVVAESEIKHLSLRCSLVPYFSSSKYWYRDSIPESSFCQYFTMPMWHYPECLWYGLLLWQCKIWNICFLDWTYYFLFYHFIRKDNWVLKSH